MTPNRESMEQRIRDLLATNGGQLNELMLKDAVEQLSARLDELSLWPKEVADVAITWIPPCSDGDGYAGWTVPDPRGPEHPSFGALYSFSREKYL